MTTIPPAGPVAPIGPTSPSAPAAPTTPTTGASALVTQMPTGMQSAGPGTVISGTVIVSRDQQGQTTLQTESGAVTFRTPATLPVGAQVSLQVQAAGSQLQAIVLSARAPVGAPLTAPIATQPLASVPAMTISPSISTGPILLATVIGPPTTTVILPSTAGQPVMTGQPSSVPTTPASSSVSQSAGTSTPANALPPPGSTVTQVAPVSPGTTPTVTVPTTSPPASPATGSASVIPSAQPTTTPAVPRTAAPASPAPTTAPNAPAPAAGSSVVAATPSLPGNTLPPPTTPAAPMAAAVARYAAFQGTPATPTAPPTPAPAPTSPASPTATATPPSLGASQGASAPTAAIPALPIAPAGAQLQVRYLGPTTAPVVAGGLVATVVGTTPAGQTIVDTALGRLSVALPPGDAHAAEGSRIAFSVIAARAGLTGLTSPALLQALPMLGRSWPALKDTLAVLAEADAPLARQLADVTLPKPSNPRFLGQLLSFLSQPATEARALLGEAGVAAVERAGRQDVLMRLEGDLREAARLNSQSTDWRMFFIPVVDTHEMRQLRIFTRKRAPKGEREKDQGRFVVEVEFEELGPLQIDGLVQKPRIDLILRSHVELPAPLRNGIVGIFEKTCGASGLNGQIFFQAVAHFPVSPLEEIAKSGGGVSV